jgi:hypothetical protein
MAPAVTGIDVFVGIDMAKQDHYAKRSVATAPNCSNARSSTTRPRSPGSSTTLAPTAPRSRSWWTSRRREPNCC